MGNQTTVKDLSMGGALAIWISGTLKYYQPDLMNSMPGAEAALAVFLTGLFAYIKKPAK